MMMSDKDTLTNDKAIDEALDFLDHGEELTDEQLEAMVDDEEAIEALGDLLQMKEVVVSASPFARINKEDEWARFKAMKGIGDDKEDAAEVRSIADAATKKHHALLYILIGVAATLLVLFGFHWYKQVSKPDIPGDMVLEAVDETLHPVLTTDDGDEIVLD